MANQSADETSYTVNNLIPVKLFRRVMQHFRHFSSVSWHYRRHVVYRRILYIIMQHYMPIKLQLSLTLTVVNGDKAAKMRRYIDADYIMLYKFVT